MRVVRAFCFAVGLAAVSGASFADQTNPLLGDLFGQLQGASGAAEATSLEQRIWAIWLEAPTPESQSLLGLGMAAMQGGNMSAALTAFDRVIAVAPDFAEGWNKRATVHYLLDNLPQSLDDIDATLALEPRHFGALSGRGLVFMKMGEPERALEAFEEALEVSPQMPGARANAEAIRDLLGQRDI